MKDLAKLNTKYNFDAIETFNNCDFPRANSVFACGSYSLNEKTKIRSGAIAMYNFGQSSPVQISFAKFDFAVTDLKWQPFSDFISSANSDGSVKIFRAEPSNSFGLELLLNFDLSNSSLALSLDWSPFDNKAIVASLSDGHIGLIDLENHSIDKFRAHNAEVWNVVFDSENPFVVYSGEFYIYKVILLMCTVFI
ncbi:WD40 repeat-containing protein, variant 2 [Bonamia ostreae]|uniref:methylated diphthine methylhydrolase n=1 Tax=Bonamia ostreae TaxID=126728 RepID=A0ABV2AFN5_9EUKA